MGTLEFIVWIAVAVVAVITIFLFHRFSKFKVAEIFDLDRKYESYYENGHVKQKTYSRPVWDYSPCPGISQILHQRGWLAPLVMVMFLVIFVIYLKTNDELAKELLKYNFGAFLGSMAQGIVRKAS
ncbi:MAG: hypothetical protein ISS79_07450 [Phycisphaerae bacterium]|nr:hypothetical protein [Phycisphaerae bacterium]